MTPQNSYLNFISKICKISYYYILQVFLQADRLKDAVSSLVAVGEWDRARRIVREFAPDLEPYLEEKYQDAITNDDQMERLTGMDGNSSLEMMARKGQWSQVFEAASLQGKETLHRFVARRAAQLLKSNSALQALQLYVQYGAPATSQNYNIYMQLAENILNETQQEYRYIIFFNINALMFSFLLTRVSRCFQISSPIAQYPAQSLPFSVAVLRQIRTTAASCAPLRSEIRLPFVSGALRRCS